VPKRWLHNLRTNEGGTLSTVEEVFMAYNRATEEARETERRLAELTNVLLLGNSFLVAAFAVMLGQPICSVVHYVVASVGIALCLLLFLGINSTWGLYLRRLEEVYRWRKELERVWEPSRPFAPYPIGRSWFSAWWPSRLFGPGTIYRVWLPCLFLFMWVMLIIFAIN